MTDELEMLIQARPEVAPYAPEAKMNARRRLTATVPRTSRRRFSTIALAGAALVTAASVAVINQLNPMGHGGVTIGAPPAVASPGVTALPDITKMSASEVLARAAKAAQGAPDLHLREDQYIKIVRQLDAFMGRTSKEKQRITNRIKTTTWFPADPSGDVFAQAERYWYGKFEENSGVAKVGTAETTYEYLESVPESKDEMRAYLYARGKEWNSADSSPDEAAWRAVIELFDSFSRLPAAQRAALFEAAGTIPGTTVTEHVEDGIGRSGIGVSLETPSGSKVDPRSERQYLIFDPTTFDPLGRRDEATNRTHPFKAGDKLSTLTVLEVTVVDKPPKEHRNPNTSPP